jgi:hypothetical protein
MSLLPKSSKMIVSTPNFFSEKTDFEIVQILCTSLPKAISTVFQDPKALAMVWQHNPLFWHIVLLTTIGAYKAWALHLPDLAVVPGFPTLIQGPASNDPTKYFIGGEILQRPGLAMIGDSIIAGFGGHCDSMNYVSCPITSSLLCLPDYCSIKTTL